ncbi:MAG: glucosamine-6-phosphate deaminase [Clostridia bacterium]|nr:glucosamine-6-phosphate deaminase [Oscillospiraceae bacterium]MBR2410625.1 glucosamine-6-phosphate deaminase [Clostridia bacterium]
MEVRIFNSADEIATACADIFSELLVTKPECVLGLATGASPVKTYTELIKRCKNGEISFSKVKTFNLDEYCDLPRDDKNSYYTFMHENLFNSVDIKEENVNILDGNAADAEKEAKEFDEKIENAGGIDIQLLGIGTNGHIGFNEPADSFSDGTFKVKLTDSTIKSNSIYFDDDSMPRYALTMGINSIMKAKKIVLIATGESKADAIKATIDGEVTPQVPASVLKNHPDAILLIDKAAAKLL